MNVSQGFPLWATLEGIPGAYAVVSWDEYGWPYLLRLDEPGAAPRTPLEGERPTFTTTDPTERPEAVPLAESVLSASEEDLRKVLARIAVRLVDLGATGPAREIRDVLDGSTLRERMGRLADECERQMHGGLTAARLIRQELEK